MNGFDHPLFYNIPGIFPPHTGVVVSLRLLRGELTALRHEYIHLLKGVPMTQKLGFPDVIMPGDVRYD